MVGVLDTKVAVGVGELIEGRENVGVAEGMGVSASEGVSNGAPVGSGGKVGVASMVKVASDGRVGRTNILRGTRVRVGVWNVWVTVVVGGRAVKEGASEVAYGTQAEAGNTIRQATTRKKVFFAQVGLRINQTRINRLSIRQLWLRPGRLPHTGLPDHNMVAFQKEPSASSHGSRWLEYVLPNIPGGDPRQSRLHSH